MFGFSLRWNREPYSVAWFRMGLMNIISGI